MGRRGLAAAYVAVFVAPFLIQLGFSLAWPDRGVSGSPELLFAIVVVAATLCVVTSALILWRGFTTKAPELVWLGLFYYSVSILPLVHGITTPELG